MPSLNKKMLFLFLGSLIMGFGIALSITGTQGADPFGLFWEGLSKTFSFSIGQANVYSNFIILIIVFFIDRKQIHIGTILNPVISAVSLDFAMQELTTPNNFTLQLLMSTLGIVILGIGVGIYTAGSLGKGPYDGLAFSISEKANINFPLVRNIADITTLIMAFIMNINPGFATLIGVFLLGKIIYVSKNFFEKLMC